MERIKSNIKNHKGWIAGIFLSSAFAASVAFIGGAYAGGFLLRGSASAVTITDETPADIDMAPFWQVWNLLDQKYIGADALTSGQKLEGAIRGMVEAAGDPYTEFFSAAEKEQFEGDINGNFGGIGIELGKKGKILTVIAPLKNTPAAKAGMKAGDQIVAINGSSSINMSIDEAISIIRGPVGEPVALTVMREGTEQPIEFKLVRATIDVPTLETRMTEDGVFVITLHNFYATSPQLFRNAITEFAKTGSNRLVLDLRDNPGGYLGAAVDISSWFLSKGEVVVTESKGEGKIETVYKSKGFNDFGRQLKMAILVNEGSASASEIVAGALRDHGIAKLVGDTTFGKGSVQEFVDLSKTTALKVTVAKWITPAGHSLSDDGGLVPDIKASISAEDLKAGRDPQLDAAIKAVMR